MCIATLTAHWPLRETFKSKTVVIEGCQAVFYDTVDSIPDDYFIANDVFLNYNFLNAVEKAAPKDYQFAYLVYLKQDKAVGFLACQVKDFKAVESLNFEAGASQKFIPLRRWIASKIRFNTLVVGSLLLTGEHSFYFNDKNLSEKEKNRLVTEGVHYIKQRLHENGTPIGATFVKDFFDPQKYLSTEGYNGFQVEPNFIFKINKNWVSFDDYLNALSSKYRIRTKRAFKMLGNVEKKEFNAERILAHQTEINHMYKTTCESSAFNLVDLNDRYFYELKQQMGEHFKLFGYFKEGQLIGFYTLIDNGNDLVAHFLGYEASLNTKYQIYLNFLYDIIQCGIQKKVENIIFARTAHEIKSSVGAKAHDMYLYLKHENPILNLLFSVLLKILSPREKWVARHPFK